jgi:hypothetical protein
VAEILIRVVDRGQTEDSSRAGDVIAVCPDGWGWSQIELTHQEWRIIKVNVLQSTVDAFLAKSQVVGVKRRREWKLDFSLLPNSSLFSGIRTQGIIALTRAQVVAAAVKKP